MIDFAITETFEVVTTSGRVLRIYVENETQTDRDQDGISHTTVVARYLRTASGDTVTYINDTTFHVLLPDRLKAEVARLKHTDYILVETNDEPLRYRVAVKHPDGATSYFCEPQATAEDAWIKAYQNLDAAERQGRELFQAAAGGTRPWKSE